MASELGDISGLLKEGSLANLDWLDVDETKAREPLPRQNLDVVPDLQAAWNHADESPSRLVPNREVHTMGDFGWKGPLRTAPADIVRTARLVMMQGSHPRVVLGALKARYDLGSIREAADLLRPVLAEHGLLGRLYVEAVDFPDCANPNSKKASEFIRRFAPGARYVLAKQDCVSCIHRQRVADGSSRCGIFHKEIQVKVPYTEDLAKAVEQSQASKGVTVTASGALPRERIRMAYLATTPREVQGFTGQSQPKPKTAMVRRASKDQALATAGQLAKENEAAAQEKLAAERARPVVALLRREMLKGRNERELLQALRLAFDVRLLQETKPLWSPTFHEAGLFGTVYATQDSFGDCREGADYLNRHSSKVRAIVAGEKCASCIFSQVGRCMMYGRKLVASTSEVFTSDTVQAVLDEQRMAGRLPVTAARQKWGSTPAEQLKAIYRASADTNLLPTSSGLRGAIERAFYGQVSRPYTAGDLTKREILKSASKYLNEGLYGQDMVAVMRSRFEVRDLAAVEPELRKVLAEQGLQGIKYIDPTAYADYGKGCQEAARLHRSRAAVRFAKIGCACGSCVHQSMPGVCSVLNKQLVEEPPYVDKAAEQKAILESGSSLTTNYESLMHNGLNMMAEYQIQNGSGIIDLNPPGVDPQVSVEFGTGSQEVKL
jgi:hypothetical protein